MSDTPRTDAAQRPSGNDRLLADTVYADFARELEAENAKLREFARSLVTWIEAHPKETAPWRVALTEQVANVKPYLG